MIYFSLFLSSTYSHNRYQAHDIQLIPTILSICLFFMLLGIIVSICDFVERKRKQEQKAREEYIKLQEKIKKENERQQRRERFEFEQSLIAQLDNALSKLESSRNNSIKANTLAKHIKEYSNFLNSFKESNPSYAHLVTSRYTRPIEYSKTSWKRCGKTKKNYRLSVYQSQQRRKKGQDLLNEKSLQKPSDMKYYREITFDVLSAEEPQKMA